MDFSKDPEAFVGNLKVVRRAWQRASTTLYERLEHWKDISQNTLEKLVTLDRIEEQNVIEGKVLDKGFRIEFSPFMLADTGYAEVVVFALDADGVRKEIGRFLNGADGSVFDTDGKIVLASTDRYSSYTVLTTILRSVLEEPAQTSSSIR